MGGESNGENAGGGSQLSHHVIPTERCGALSVYIQGDLELAHGEDKDKRCVFLMVHDIGNNHHQWLAFTNHQSMNDIRSKSIFILVDLLGQEDDGEDLPSDKKYPTMQEFGEDLVNILDTLRVKFVIGVGIGVGANIIARFGMMHKTRCLGIVLLHPTATKPTVMDNLKDKMSKLVTTGKISKKNADVLAQAYLKRTDMTSNLNKNLQCETLLVCGNKNSVNALDLDSMYAFCDKTKTSQLKIDDVNHVLDEVPVKLAQSILLFCKGLGWLTSLTLPGIERQRSSTSQSSDDGGAGGRRKSMSMEEYDRPNIRRLSLTPATAPE